MKKGLKLLGLAVGVVALMALTLGGTVFADTPEETDTQIDCEAGWGGWQGGDTCSETVGDLLGLTHEEIEAQRHEGKSMVEIAAAQGVSEDTLVEAILVAKREAIQEKVEAGILTQEQSDRMFQQMEQRTIEAVNRTTIGPFGPHEDRGAGACGQQGQGMGPGAMRQWGKQDGNGARYGDTEPGAGPGQMQRWGRGTN